MKKIIILALSATLLFAKSYKPSKIEPAEIFYINLQTKICNTRCLENLIGDGLFISFLTQFDEQFATDDLKNLYITLNNNGILGEFSDAEVKIGVLIPEKVIKSYAIVVTNAIFSYAIKRNLNSNFGFFFTQNESPQNIKNALSNAKIQGYTYIIAPFTNDGLSTILSEEYNDMFFYIPTINMKNVAQSAPNIVFGGIDYEAQINKLLYHANQKIAVFSDEGALAGALNNHINRAVTPVFTKTISGNKFNLKPILSGNSNLKNASIFLNTSLIKTALLASQFRVYNLRPHALLSTQINYNNALIALTQPNDRKNLYIANSITQIDDEIAANNALLGRNIEYDWVTYSTTFGVDFFYTSFINKNAAPLFSEKIDDYQVDYDILIMRGGEFGFKILE